MRNYLSQVGVMALLFAAEADAGADPAPTPPAAEATPAPAKRYLATAKLRDVDKYGKGENALPLEVKFIVEDPDYKTAWQTARAVTREGTSEIEGATFFAEDGTSKLVMRPGRYTVGEVASLQDRSSKKEAITLDQLEQALKDAGVNVPKQLQSVIDDLRASPGATTAEAAKEPETGQVAA